MHYIDGTHLEAVKNQKLRRNNTSGYRGVCMQHGKWKAYIRFQGHVYSLGAYHDIRDAVKARLDAEERLYKPFIKQCEKRA